MYSQESLYRKKYREAFILCISLTLLNPLWFVVSFPLHVSPTIRKAINLHQLSAFWDKKKYNVQSEDNYENETTLKTQSNQIPFVIDSLDEMNRLDNEEISRMVIKVFFEEEAESKQNDINSKSKRGAIMPWKAWQLGYLRSLQNYDLNSKKRTCGDRVLYNMFVAREVIPASSVKVVYDVVDHNSINNIDDKIKSGSNENYVRGRVLGFVDITEKSFGISSNFELEGMMENSTEKLVPSPRPVLTNLAVSDDARLSGVGSKLVESCEDAVLTLWPTEYNEIILEVEEENLLAQNFYERRGYKALFSDPASRRYDTSGFLLQKVRTTKICYRKDLSFKKVVSTDDNLGLSFFMTMRDKLVNGILSHQTIQDK